jgi:hypothetical protein
VFEILNCSADLRVGVPGARTGAPQQPDEIRGRVGTCVGVAIRRHLAPALSGSTCSGLPRARCCCRRCSHAWVSTRSYARVDGHRGGRVWQRARRWGAAFMACARTRRACLQQGRLGWAAGLAAITARARSSCVGFRSVSRQQRMSSSLAALGSETDLSL